MGKLVRDKIPDIIRNAGRVPRVITLTDEDYRAALSLKLQEEVAELLAADGSEAIVEEAADILEVLCAIVVEHGAALESIVEVAQCKRSQRGGFEMRVWLESADALHGPAARKCFFDFRSSCDGWLKSISVRRS